MRQTVAKRLRRQSFDLAGPAERGKAYHFHEEGHSKRWFFKIFNKDTGETRDASGSIRLNKTSVRSIYQDLKKMHMQRRRSGNG